MNKKFTLSINFKLLLGLALAFGLGFALAWWSPWTASQRTVTVTGESTITAKPDEFVFNPYFTASAKDRAAANTAVRKNCDQVVAKLQELGVAQEDIKTDITAYDFSTTPEDDKDAKFEANCAVTITLDNEQLAQSVFDYLSSTKAQGSISPQVSFSNDTRANLKSEARKEAVGNARTQADEIAGELSQKVVGAVSVEEVAGFDVIPLYGGAEARPADLSLTQSSDFQPGQQELTFSVKVVFGLR